jgi:uracil-DNA glycosylase family 4
VARVLAEAPPCPGCGARGTSLAGKGSARARLVVLAADPAGIGLVGASGAMLDNMLVKVLALERSDVYVIEANACAVAGRTGTCRDLLLRQVDLVAPGVVLSMGADLLPGLRSPRGEWSSHGAIDVMPTFHPTELVTRPADKRAALEHLTALRKRL